MVLSQSIKYTHKRQGLKKKLIETNKNSTEEGCPRRKRKKKQGQNTLRKEKTKQWYMKQTMKEVAREVGRIVLAVNCNGGLKRCIKKVERDSRSMFSMQKKERDVMNKAVYLEVLGDHLFFQHHAFQNSKRY